MFQAERQSDFERSILLLKAKRLIGNAQPLFLRLGANKTLSKSAAQLREAVEKGLIPPFLFMISLNFIEELEKAEKQTPRPFGFSLFGIYQSRYYSLIEKLHLKRICEKNDGSKA